MTAFAGLWAVDGVMEFPFAAPGSPQRLDGRAAVQDYLHDYTDHVDLREVVDRTLHRTTDPDVVIVEFEVDGVALATGNAYRLRYVAVVTVRGGEIAHYRDYWSPLAVAEAIGRTGLPAGAEA
ncbi:nuclear transport factor 2 family protein [Pseudonocardia sp. KRD-291]|nr:nuclear transport factor 2 family protein [Pseudonocardia sp. KRD291]